MRHNDDISRGPRDSQKTKKQTNSLPHTWAEHPVVSTHPRALVCVSRGWRLAAGIPASIDSAL